MKKITIHTDKAAIRTDNPFIPIIRFAERRKLLTFVSALLLLTGCVKDDLHNTPHPDQGAVVITTDWMGRSSDAISPGSYILRIGTQEQTVSGEMSVANASVLLGGQDLPARQRTRGITAGEDTNVFNALFPPGEQDLLVYHQTKGMTVNGSTATVNTLADGTLEPMPGYLFSAARKLEIEKDDTLMVTVPMRQHIRRLTLALNLKAGDEQRIRTTAATLTNMASAVDLTTGAITSTEGTTVIPAFALGTEAEGTTAAGQPQLSATMRLLGVVAGERQMLTLNITLTTGHVQTITTDLTEMLKDFDTGADMEPLELDATLELPTEAGFTATISDWNVVDNGPIDIH